MKVSAEMTNTCLLFFFQVQLRDKEIDRLNQALQGGRPQDVISLEAQNATHEKMIANLNLQACMMSTMSTQCVAWVNESPCKA